MRRKFEACVFGPVYIYLFLPRDNWEPNAGCSAVASLSVFNADHDVLDLFIVTFCIQRMSDIELYSQAGPSHQRRASEIIDVDALPDEIAAGPSSSTRQSQSISLSNSPPVHGRPPARRQRVVYVIDSDDDEAAPRPLSGV